MRIPLVAALVAALPWTVIRNQPTLADSSSPFHLTHREKSTAFHHRGALEVQQSQPFTDNAPAHTKLAGCVKNANDFTKQTHRTP